MIDTKAKIHNKRLNDKEIIIREIFKRKDKKELYHSSDGKENDVIINIPMLKKQYFFNGKKVYTLNNINKEISYTYISNSDTEKVITCPNCGNSAKEIEFESGCPFCGSNFNMQYSSKSSSTNNSIKEYLNLKIVKALIVIISLILITIMWFVTGNQTNMIERIVSFVSLSLLCIAGTYIATLLIAMPLFFIRIIANSIRNRGIYRLLNARVVDNIDKLLNNINVELANYYYDENRTPKYKDLIDFNILRYSNFFVNRIDDNELYIVAFLKVKKVYFKDNKIYNENSNLKIRLKRNNVTSILENGYNVIKCVNCGASIDISAQECEYCHTKNIFKNEFSIEEFILD